MTCKSKEHEENNEKNVSALLFNLLQQWLEGADGIEERTRGVLKLAEEQGRL